MADFTKVGIDIGTNTIKIVELEPSGKDKWKLISAASVATPAGGIVTNAANVGTVSQIMAKMIREIGIRSRRAVISLPEEQVSSHVVEMPYMNDDEVKKALAWQVEQYIPIPADKAVWSHQIVKKDQSAGTMEVLLVAAAKNLVNLYTSAVDQAGLEVVAIETELMATARAVKLPEVPLFVVADIGANGTNLGIISHDQLVFTRSIPTGGTAFTRAIESGLSLDTATAEQYKNSYGFSEDKLKGELVKVMQPVLAVIAGEIRKTIDFYISKHPTDQVRMVITTGGVSALPELVSRLSGLVGTEVVVGNPLSRIQMNQQQASAMEGTAPIYTVAMGLAMRSV